MNAIPRWLLGYGAANSLDGSLISWSAATALPMVMILGVGVPLRLAAYSGLGTDFTFALTRPDQLVTTGLYGLVQHPSYTGLACLMIGNTLLLCRADGALACWVPPAWYGTVRAVWTLAMPLGLGAALCVMWMRVRQEERMLRTEFGKKWERWHATTARFIPGLF
jgi:protein-S-isoprenylcysteine O-methyltransferase Ste14